MGKIKGWKKQKEMVWVNNNSNLMIFVDEEVDGKYYSLLRDRKTKETGAIVRGVNKSQAVKMSVDFMKEHPMG